jgi:transglutaminase-like putative cysteine protease
VIALHLMFASGLARGSTRKPKLNLIRALVMAALAVPAALASPAARSPVWAAEAAPPSHSRTVHFDYRARLGPFPSGARRVEAWIPLPRDDAWQKVTGLAVETPAQHEIVMQTTNGNRLVHLSAPAPMPKTIPVDISFDVTRREEAPDLGRAARVEPEPRDGGFARWLGPDRLVPIDGEIARISDRIGDRNAAPYRQARAIYEYVISDMKYDKSGTGWGRGDAIYACDVHRGNCTDFHSLFIALARARGIPARFTIGFPLGPHAQGVIPGYHCWAEFYSAGVWVPIDASEAWQNRARHDYYFGHLDPDRVGFTMGRDLRLKPHQRGGPVNFLIYPYVEVDGRPLAGGAESMRFSYRDLGHARHQQPVTSRTNSVAR